MRKLMVAAAVAVSALSSGAAFAVTPVVWEGAFELTGATASCAAGNIGVSDYGTGVFRPKLTGSSTNTGNAGISFMFTRSGSVYVSTLTTAPIASSGGYAGVEVSGHASGLGGFTGAMTIAHSPATISAATPFIYVTGHIANFDNISGCTVGFKGSYVLKT